ncbi:uncharacterized protein LOC106130665 isoform X2 [Amyelois transitella]|uniref:uncharacterized protein LOC106130665 isoform X2 n=1 Tax=Amyelois transitella TaxID=680683 RepID=UPI00067C6048|nr:uncharacterized protein LOC106130665 isoform X2 [Amyelois transitella]
MYLLILPAIFGWQSVSSDIVKIVLNTSVYIDRSENILRVPNITRFEGKKKPLKRPPKRTVQKIIRKNKMKRKYAPVVTQPSQTKEQAEQYDNFNYQEEPVIKNVSTPQTNQKKQKKWNKLVRYPMPFKKTGHNKDSQKNLNVFRRYKRSDDRKDLFILNDLDEMEFLSKNKDYDVVSAHLQNHW